MPDIRSWLHHLRILTPPSGAIVVGAGMGSWIKLLNELEMPTAHFIEADERQFQHLQTRLPNHGRWLAIHALVGKEQGEVAYYQASSPLESGLLPPECLRGIWPNITATAEESREARSLAGFLEETSHTAQPNWLVIDCLPALPMLQGLGKGLQDMDVIVVRAIKDMRGRNQILQSSLESDVQQFRPSLAEGHGLTAQGDNEFASQLNKLGATLQEVESWLSDKGYRRLHSQEERNPTLVNALFIRDLSRTLDEQHKDCSSQIALIRNACIDADHKAQESESKVLVLEKEKAELAQELGVQSKFAKDLEQEISKLRQVNTVAEKLASERLQQQYELQQRNKVLEAENEETSQRYKLLEEELSKAEAQIDLIQEILLPKGQQADAALD